MSEAIKYGLPEHLAARRSAKRREWGAQLCAALVAAACFVGAGLFVGPVNTIRQERQLVPDPEAIGTLPPDIALLGKLGTFRALAIDWASIRADRLKEEGKTYEALQLHLTVCRLAPRFSKIWANAAWNMAYNISVSQYTPEARWQWVQNGIKLLRDEGIRYNPKAVELYKELAWIIWHKIGGYLDDEHLNYKKAFAVEMERVLGPPPVTVSDEEYFDWFRKIVDAPRDFEELLRSDTQVARLAARLDKAGLGAPNSLLDFMARNIRPELRVEDLLTDKPNLGPLRARRLEIITDPKEAEALDRLVAAVRSQVLREQYRLDLDWMMDLMEGQYGPLDWRNAFSHGLYWSSWGDKVCRTQGASNLSDKMNTARLVFFALQSLVTRGKLVLWPDFDDPFASYVAFTPDTRYIPYLYETYLRLGKEHFGDHPAFKEGTPGPNYMNGFVSNMHNWIQLLYLEGGERNLAQAENFYAWLRENNPHPGGSTQEQYLVTLHDFVLGNTREQLLTYKAASGIIRSLIDRAIKYYSLGQSEAAVTSLKRARFCYETWMADTRNDRNDRRRMQTPRLILRDQIEAYVKSAQIGPLFKATLWAALPLEQRQMVYDRLQPHFERLCQTRNPPWAVGRAFPEPPGMETFRKQQIEYRGERREDVEQGERYKP